MAFDRSKADPDALKDVRAVFAEEDQSTCKGEGSSSAHLTEDIGMQGSTENVTLQRLNVQEPPDPFLSQGADGSLTLNNIEQVQDDSHGNTEANQTENGDHLSTRADSPLSSEVATEIVEEPEMTAPNFMSYPAPEVIARDYAYAPSPNPPLALVFPILTTYIWFMYNRMRVIKQKPRIVLDAFQTAYTGCDLVHLMHYNWISMKDMNCLDAREGLGRGLIQLYKRPQNVEISYGAKRPHPNSPLMRKWFSRFDKCKTIQESVIKVPPKRRWNYERQKINFYGPFGEAIHRYFPMEEHPVLRDLETYLLGKGPKPSMTEKMEAVFMPILESHEGAIGGRGKPHERPRANGECEVREGTAPELIDADPLIVAEEYSNVPAFGIYRKERAKQRERERRAAEKAEQERAKGSTRKRRTKKQNWTRKKSRKGAKNSEPPEVSIIDVDLEEGRRCTRSIAQAAKDTGKAPPIPKSLKARGRTKAPREDNDATIVKDKGKGKAILSLVDSPPGPVDWGKGKTKYPTIPENLPTALRRERVEEEEDVDIEKSDPFPGEAGPSARPPLGVDHRRTGGDNEEAARRLQVFESVRVVDNEGLPEFQRGTKRGGTERESSEEHDGPSKKRRLDESGSSERLVALHPLGDASETGSSTAAELLVDAEAPAPASVDASSSPGSPTRVESVLSAQNAATSDVDMEQAEEQQAELEPQPFIPPSAVPGPATIPAPAVPQTPENLPAPAAPRPLRRTETLLFFGKVRHTDR